jgi:hypothetical protein
MIGVTGAAPKNFCHSSDYRAGEHHQALLLESAGRRQVPIPDCHNSSTEKFRPPHQDHSHATARCPIKGIEGAAIPICASDTIGAAPCESGGPAGTGHVCGGESLFGRRVPGSQDGALDASLSAAHPFSL